MDDDRNERLRRCRAGFSRHGNALRNPRRLDRSAPEREDQGQPRLLEYVHLSHASRAREGALSAPHVPWRPTKGRMRLQTCAAVATQVWSRPRSCCPISVGYAPGPLWISPAGKVLSGETVPPAMIAETV